MSKKSSFVWRHFSVVVGDEGKARCDLCNAEISRGGNSTRGFNTTNLSRHLMSFHDYEISADALKIETMPDSDASHESTSEASTSGTRIKIHSTPAKLYKCDGLKQTSVSELFTKKTPLQQTSPKAVKITRLITEMICKDLQPFSFVEDPGFCNLMAYLEPRYTIPHRSTFSRKLIPELYNETQYKMKLSLKSVLHGSLTLDMWSSISKQDYMSLTLHLFTSEMERLEYCLEVIPFIFHHHTAGNISSFLKTTLEAWEISKSKIHCVITDNAKNMILGMKEAGLDRAPCAAHTLQLVVNNSVLKQKNVHEMCSRAKKVVGHFHHSVLATKKLAEFQQQNSLPQNRLKQDEPTRWDSTFFMLQRLFEQRKAVMYLLPELNLLVDLSSADWALMEKVLPLLELFHRATLAVSNSQTTISEIIPIVNGLKMNLEQISNESVHVSMHPIVKDVVYHLNEYYCNVETEGNLFRFATILDPRFKTSVFSEPRIAEQARQALLQELENELPVEPTESKVLRLAVPSGPMSSVYSRLIAAKSNSTVENRVSVSTRQQLHKYLAEPLLTADESPFLYWNSSEFKSLKKLAVKYLTPPAASTPSERLFSTAGLISSKKRSSLNPEKVRMLVFLNKNLQYFT